MLKSAFFKLNIPVSVTSFNICKCHGGCFEQIIISERFKLWDWRLSECRAIKDILCLSDEEAMAIFFSTDGASEATIEEGM